MGRAPFFSTFFVLLMACDDSPTQSTSDASEEVSDYNADTSASGDTASDADDGAADAAITMDAAAPGPDAGPGPVNDVPIEGSALNRWLQEGRYLDFAAEPAIHPSAGPHGNMGVRTFFNPILDQASREGTTVWPVGSAAVKELYDRNGELDGWAVEVKINEDSNFGTLGGGWYWYEVLSVDPNATPVADGTGAGICVGCHAGGVDFMTTPYPLAN